MAARRIFIVAAVVLGASDIGEGRPTLGGPLQFVKTLSLGAGGAGGTLGSSLSISVPPPPTTALEALDEWKRAVVGGILKAPVIPLPSPLPAPPSPPAPPPPVHHHYHHDVGDCCRCGSSSSSSGDSSAASSEEDRVGSEDARLERCVRTVAPNMMAVSRTYADVAKMNACAAEGMRSLVGGASPEEVRDAVMACMDAAAFDPPLAPFVQDFNACVSRVFT